MQNDFIEFFRKNYEPIKGIPVGRPVYNKTLNQFSVNIPLKTLTRHGLVTGSTGTGKSRVIQLMIEKLAEEGVPVLLSDIKGDMSGFSHGGVAERIAERAKKLDYKAQTRNYATNYWGNGEGLISFRVKAEDIDFVILAKLLELNSTQESHLGVIYNFAKEKNLELRTLNNLKEIVGYLIKYPDKSIGSSTASLGVIHRKIINLEYGNLDKFFGEPKFSSADLLSNAINILWLQNYQKEKFNAGNLMALALYSLYNELPEIGESEKPKMILFIDEAHQIFNNANSSLVNLMVAILKQIRSKGIGIIFNTQNADDLPEKILEQLGLKIQFALRAFSQKELQDIKGAVDSFPETNFYDLRQEIKALETGVAFVSVINEAGALLAPVKTAIFPPASYMDALSSEEISRSNNLALIEKYSKNVDNNLLNLGSPLDNITVSRGGKWQIGQYLARKEDQKTNREIRKRNRGLRKILYIIVAILALLAVIFFLYLVYLLLNKV